MRWLRDPVPHPLRGPAAPSQPQPAVPWREWLQVSAALSGPPAVQA